MEKYILIVLCSLSLSACEAIAADALMSQVLTSGVTAGVSHAIRSMGDDPQPVRRGRVVYRRTQYDDDDYY